jgi:O-antigen/teichoic acid export membrane protein
VIQKIMKRLPSDYWRDIGWQASGNTLAQVIGIAGMPFLTRIFSPSDFAIQSLFLQLVTLGTAIVTWRYEYFIQLPKEETDARALERLVHLVGFAAILVLTPLIWFFRSELSSAIGEPALAPFLWLVPMTSALVSWGVLAQNVAQRHKDFPKSGLSELVGKIAYLATGLIGGLLQFGAAALILTTSCAAIAKIALLNLTRRVFLANRPSPNGLRLKRMQKEYRRLATSTVFSHILSTAAVTLPQIAIAKLYNSDVLGNYALVIATIYLPSGLLGTAIGQVYYQRASALWAEGKDFNLLWKETVKKLITIGIPAFAGISAISIFAYPWVFGAQWQLAGTLASIMAFAAFGSFVSSPMDRSCLVVGAWRYSVLWSLFRLISTGIVLTLSSKLDFDIVEFTIALVIQMITVYAVDLSMSYRFSQRRDHTDER